MGAFFVYILKSSVCLIAFYLFYRLLLSRDTFHRFNRLALLGLVLLSVIIPFIRFSVKEPVIMQQSLLDIEQLLMMVSVTPNEITANTPLWVYFILWMYIMGGIIFGSRFIYCLYHMYKIIHKGEETHLDKGIHLFITKESITPFSWMKYIVVSQKDMNESGREILAHETAHIRNNHSIDLLIAEICILLHWFNPASWLIKQELQNIHEYEADESVIQQGIDAKKYQLLLIKKAVGSQRFNSMANSFNHSSLKKRITMMLKRKSNPWARLKYLFVLPLAAFTIAAFARPEISRELEKISIVKINETLSTKQEEKTEMIKDITGSLSPTIMRDEISDKGKPISEMRSVIVERVNVINDEQKDSVVVMGYGDQKETNPTGFKFLNSDTSRISKPVFIPNPPIKIHASLSSPLKEKNAPLIFVDGVELVDRDLKKIDARQIASVSVVKDESSIKLFGERAKDGVILVQTKNGLDSKKTENE